MRGIRLPVSNELLSAPDLDTLRQIPGVNAMGGSLLLWDFDQSGFRTLMGVDLSQPGLGPVHIKDWMAQGRFPDKPGEAVLEKHFAKFRNLKLGDTMAIGSRSFLIVGLLEIREGVQVAAANIYLPLADAQSLLDNGDKCVNLVYLRLRDPGRVQQTKTDIIRALPGMSVASSDAMLEVMGGVSRISDQFSLVVSLVALAGAVFLIIKTMLGNLVERSREIGILKAVGWTGGDVRKQLMGEVFLQAVAGGNRGHCCGLCGFLPPRLSVHSRGNAMGSQFTARFCQGSRYGRQDDTPARDLLREHHGGCSGPVHCRRVPGQLFYEQADGKNEAGGYSPAAVGESCHQDRMTNEPDTVS